MKNFHRFTLILLISILLPSHTNAQSATYTTNSGLNIGFGVGSSYQVSDIKNSTGYGFDLRLGSYLYKKENAFLSVDWKFRFLAGSNKAYDHRENAGNTYSNLMLNHFNYDLELGLTLNRLRERTRIVVTGFFGAGLTHGITSSDMLDGTGTAYDYSGIDPTDDPSVIVADLKNLSDGDFETKLENKAAVLPTAGIYLGYQLSPSFTLGVNYKINFSLGENAGAFALNMDNMIDDGSSIDMNHYVSLGFKWTMMGRSERAKRYRVNTSQAVVAPPATERVIATPSDPGPEVDITIPYRDIHTTSNRDVDITARVLRVYSKNDITVKYNGDDIEFEFSSEAGKIELPVHMVNDSNNLVITCRNEHGSATDDVTLIYKESTSNTIQRPSTPLRVTTPVTINENTRVNPIKIQNEAVVVNETVRQNNTERRNDVQQVTVPGSGQPEVRIVNPTAPSTVDKNLFNIRAQTTNILSWQDVEVKVNGINNSNFNFTREGIVSLNIALREGENQVSISVKNEAGTALDKTTLTYKKTVTVPVVDDITPVVQEIVQQVDTVQEVVEIVEITQVIPPVDTVREVVEIVEIEEITPTRAKPTGVRINPGNSAWQFCLVTPSGKFNRDNLKDEGFSYTGLASSLYFKPIGGGGNAIVNGKEYILKAGQYYLFSGSLTVTVSTKNPGSMGHWSVIILAATPPVTGKGNKQPVSPCATDSESGR